ncbi:MAG TPA: hypothetical protein PK398_01085 [Candidatus Gracilibacteria bacterium]|nr:hypothetical protein [Candidatus Gracilibacteria bacterium]
MAGLDSLNFRPDQEPLIKELERGFTMNGVDVSVAREVAMVAFRVVEAARVCDEPVEPAKVVRVAEVAALTHLDALGIDVDRIRQSVLLATVALATQVLEAEGIEYTDEDVCGEIIPEDSIADFIISTGKLQSGQLLAGQVQPYQVQTDQRVFVGSMNAGDLRLMGSESEKS